jgi:choline dehydrogenase-like flavoprotein
MADYDVVTVGGGAGGSGFAVRTTVSWYTRVFLERGPEADALRARVLPQLESDPALLPETLIAGPDWAPPTAEHRAKIFGEPLRHDPIPAA